jgi:hypothetical protein
MFYNMFLIAIRKSPGLSQPGAISISDIEKLLETIQNKG